MNRRDHPWKQGLLHFSVHVLQAGLRWLETPLRTFSLEPLPYLVRNPELQLHFSEAPRAVRSQALFFHVRGMRKLLKA